VYIRYQFSDFEFCIIFHLLFRFQTWKKYKSEKIAKSNMTLIVYKKKRITRPELSILETHSMGMMIMVWGYL